MKLKILKYNKEKAKRNFVLFKLAEIFGAFLFFIGFNGLGHFIYNRFPEFAKILINPLQYPITYFDFWVVGFGTLFTLCLSLAIICGIILLIYTIFKAWIKANWRWAQKSAEDCSSKEERIKEQGKLKKIKEIEKMEKDRVKWGYCKGDNAIRVTRGDFGEVGDKFKIEKVNCFGEFSIKYNGRSIECIVSKKFIFTKNPIPKRPILNKVRQKEIAGRKNQNEK